MNVDVKLFAAARQLARQDSVPISLQPGDTIAELRQALQEQCPQLEALLARAMFSVDQQYATDQTQLSADMEVACIPPVSGG